MAMSEGEAAAVRRLGIGIVGPSQERIERLGAWYGAEHERLVRFAYLLTHDTAAAEDLVQEAFIKIYRASARVEERGLPGYARQVILNLARSTFRRRVLERRALEGMSAGPDSSDPDLTPAIDVRQALLRLSMPDRACLALRYYEGMSDRDIAAMLSIGHAAAQKRVERAHARLRALLSEEER